MKIDKNLILLKWFNFFLDFRPYSPIAIIYFSQITGSYTLGIAVFSVVQVASAIFEVPTGVASDILGRKGTIIVGAFAGLLSIIVYAIGGSFAILALGSVFAGFSKALFSGNNEALLYDSLKENDDLDAFPDWLGKTGAMFQVGLGVSAFIGGFIADWSLSFVMWISVVPQVIAFIIAIQMREPKIHSDKVETNIYAHIGDAFRQFKENYKLRNLSYASILDSSIGELAYKFQPAFIAMIWPTWAIGAFRGLISTFAVTGFWFAGKYTKAFGMYRIWLISQSFTRALGLVAYVIPTVLSPLMLALKSLAYGFDNVTRSTMLHGEFNDRQRATMGSLNAFVGSILFVIMGYFFGSFADEYGAIKALLVFEIVMFIKLYWYWKVWKIDKALIKNTYLPSV